MIDLSHQIALITGGANGIGKGIAESLAKAGAKVIIGDIDEQNGTQTAKALGGAFYPLDVSDQKNVHDVVDQIVHTHGKIDILASNTGIYPQIEIENLTEDDWDQIQNINLKGMFFVTQAVLKYMKKQRYGRVIITSSVTGRSYYGLSRLGTLWCNKSWPTRLYAKCSTRICKIWYYD